MLFPGPKQEERFGAILLCVLEKHKDELLELGYEPNDIGVHSIRKGAGTYASSGTTAAPSSVSVNNRGGWTLGGVRDVYMLLQHTKNTMHIGSRVSYAKWNRIFVCMIVFGSKI